MSGLERYKLHLRRHVPQPYVAVLDRMFYRMLPVLAAKSMNNENLKSSNRDPNTYHFNETILYLIIRKGFQKRQHRYVNWAAYIEYQMFYENKTK